MSDITKWQNNTYVLLSDLHDDHEIALVENSLRDSEFFYEGNYHLKVDEGGNVLGVYDGNAGYWTTYFKDRLLTRTQALKLAGVEL